jgi:hypothetical protein
MSQFFGKYRGIVEENYDLLGKGRLLVRVPAVFGDGKVWAWPCVPYAGPGIGFFAMPPKKANIWVEFGGGNPEIPIWSGCFWDDGESAPVAATPLAAMKKMLKTDNCALTFDDTPGTGGVKIEMGNATIVIDPLKVEIKRGKWSIKITELNVSINDGGLEVT